MPIDPESLQKFLDRAPLMQPLFKGETPAKLERLIYDSTGLPFAEITKSRPHQLEGIAFALWKRRALLLYHMRLGKTKIALDWAAHLRRAGLASGMGLVIAHAPIGADVWESEAAKHSRLRVRVVRSSSHASEDLADAIESDAQLLIMAHSTLQSLFTVKRLSRKGVPKLYPDVETLALAAECFTHCIIDETHLCANHTSLRFAICEALVSECKQRLGLTGTPVGRDPFALWAQAFLVDAGVTLTTSFYFFEAAFGEKRKNKFVKKGEEITFDKSKLAVLRSKMAGIALAYGKDEVKSAEVFAGTVELRMSPPQRAAYNDAVEKLVKFAGQDIELRSTFVRLRQIASGYLPFSDDIGEKHIVHFEGSVKLAWLKEFLEEVPDDTQCVIFHEFTHSGELICKLLKEAGKTHSWLYGEAEDKRGAREDFQKGAAQFLVANTQTGGTSIDLPMADYLCFFESPVSPRTREQAQARPMARGDRPLMMDDLICAPIERKILGFIKEGRDLSQALVHGGKKLAESLRD